MGEYGYHPIVLNFLNHASHINDVLQEEKACSLLSPLREFGHHMTSPMSMCFTLCDIWNNDLMMCIQGGVFHGADVTFLVFISVFLFHDAHVREKEGQ